MNSPHYDQDTRNAIYTVSQLNREVRAILEGSFPLIQVEGEISNLARPASGHMYFSLKDEQAQVRCAMFRNRNSLLGFKPENGQKVILRARVSLYEGRGEFQLIGEHMEEAGFGALQRAFEALKRQLGEEGLFEEECKQALPGFPGRIGVITSPTGAAIRDILHVLERRYPLAEVRIYPVAVQGGEAIPAISSALKQANQDKSCDVLILARGGGSLEDLWAFNEEQVARAVAESELPVISGVGHETDFTIVDFVADYRAPTPSAAAEIATPDAEALLNEFISYESYLYDSVERLIQSNLLSLKHLSGRLHQQHPQRRVEQSSLRVDELEQRLARAAQNLVRHKRLLLDRQIQSLYRVRPSERIAQLSSRLSTLRLRLKQSILVTMNSQGNRLSELARALNAYSPLSTLDRGYALALREGQLVRSIEGIESGDQLSIRLADGELLTRVESKKPLNN
jgi:exodeoxyribonuclease VII large subunit